MPAASAVQQLRVNSRSFFKFPSRERLSGICWVARLKRKMLEEATANTADVRLFD